MKRGTRVWSLGRWLGMVLVLGPAAPTQAGADWVVTQDGHQIETLGAWEVRQGMVVFTLPNGTLSSLRLAEVDLEASREATEEAEAAARRARNPEPEPTRPPVLVLTDADVKRATPEDAAPGAGTEEAEREGKAASLLEGQLRLDDWRVAEGPPGQGIHVEGRISNPTADFATGVFLSVLLYAEDGSLVQAAPAELTSRVLPPGQSAGFRASFRGIERFAYIRFSAEGQTAKVAPEGSLETQRSRVQRLSLEP